MRGTRAASEAESARRDAHTTHTPRTRCQHDARWRGRGLPFFFFFNPWAVPEDEYLSRGLPTPGVTQEPRVCVENLSWAGPCEDSQAVKRTEGTRHTLAPGPQHARRLSQALTTVRDMGWRGGRANGGVAMYTV